MIKRIGIVIVLGLCGFALGTVLARITGEEAPRTADRVEDPGPSALRHITQLPPPAAEKAAREAPRSGR